MRAPALRLLAVFSSAVVCTPALSAAPATVLHAESVELAFDTEKSFSNGVTRASFDALGRRFDLELISQTQLNAAAKSSNASAIAFRGIIKGQPTSWVRLTRIDDTTHALIWDGKELIALAPTKITPITSSSIATDAKHGGHVTSTAVFRLADTLIDPNRQTCESMADSTNGAMLYDNLHLNARNKSQSAAAYRLQLSALMDDEYLHRYASATDATNALIARLNNVDGIFTAQLGIHVELQYSGTAANAGTSILTSSTAANDVLQSLGILRSSSARLYNTGVTHLFTGRELDGRSVGLAYVGAVCGQRYGVSLSQIYGDTVWYDSLIVAHELGHTFGAEHDGEGACASVPTSFLMAATIGNTDRFSQCSLERIRRQMPNAGCLTALPHADFAISNMPAETQGATMNQFEWTLAVTNLGDVQATRANVQITLPPALILHGTSGDAICSAGAGVVDCPLGNVDSHSVRTIRLALSTSLAGNYRIGVMLDADIDANSTNNSGESNVVITTPQASAANLPPAASNATTSESEGGGAFSFQWLFVLGVLLASRRRYLRSQQ
jgi:Metallo-peptidase family M12/Domain of unknown function DUF11